MFWFTCPVRKDVFAVPLLCKPAVREKLFRVPSAGGLIVILLIAVGHLQFTLEMTGLCAPCPQPQEFKARDHSKSCARNLLGFVQEL